MASPAEPRLPRHTRARWAPQRLRPLALRGLAWTAISAVVAGVLGRSLPIDLVAPAALGGGFALSFLPSPWALPAGLGVAAALYGAGAVGANPLWVGGAFAGAFALALIRGPTLMTTLQGTLAGAATASLGAELVGLLPASFQHSPWFWAAGVGIIGLAMAQTLWLGAIDWTSSDRVPSPRVINNTLAPPFREPCHRAWTLDGALATEARDPDTRDGLGEVAAWVYRLSWTLAALARELEAMDPTRLGERLEQARKAASEASDALTREPREATVRHIEQLVAHRDAIALEMERTRALIDYALAFLEQARAGLTLARVRPGEGMPDRLSEVLDRLRSQTAEGDARRRTARQLTPLA